MACFDSQSMTTNMAVKPDEDGSCLMKSIKMEFHGRLGTVKSGSTSVGGPVKSGQKRTKDKGRGLDKRLVWLELVTAWIQ